MLVCPAWSDLPSTADASSFPLHVKDVAGSVDYDAVLNLPVTDPEILNHLRIALRWVRDITMYTNRRLPPYRRYPPRLTDEHMATLRKYGKFVIVSHPRCGVKAFFVIEWAKKRLRSIFAPDINAVISKDELQASRLPLRPFVRSIVAEYLWMLQFDFASFYDQLPVAPEIQPLFSVVGRECLANLPMGFRAAVEVAQAISLVIADLGFDDVAVIVYIDNILLLCNDPARLVEAANVLLERAKKVGAVFNDYSLTPTQTDDFIGEHFDLAASTRTNSAKTKDKLQHALTNIQSFVSFRDIAALFGLLFFASEVADLKLAKFFPALTYYRAAMSAVASRSWDDLAPPLIGAALESAAAWLTEARTATPAPIVLPPTSPTFTIYCDASEWGWGAVSIGPNAVHHLSGQWSEEDRKRYNVKSSLVAEPLGIWRAVSAVATLTTPAITIFTDHKNLTFKKKYSKNKNYNDLYEKLDTQYKNTRFTFNFIPGVQNTMADFLSRGSKK